MRPVGRAGAGDRVDQRATRDGRAARTATRRRSRPPPPAAAAAAPACWRDRQMADREHVDQEDRDGVVALVLPGRPLHRRCDDRGVRTATALIPAAPVALVLVVRHRICPPPAVLTPVVLRERRRGSGWCSTDRCADRPGRGRWRRCHGRRLLRHRGAERRRGGRGEAGLCGRLLLNRRQRREVRVGRVGREGRRRGDEGRTGRLGHRDAHRRRWRGAVRWGVSAEHVTDRLSHDRLRHRTQQVAG